MCIEQVVTMLKEEGLSDKKGFATFEMAGVSFKVVSKDIIGGVLQEWFEN